MQTIVFLCLKKKLGKDLGSLRVRAAKKPGVKLQVMMIVWSASHVLLSASIRAWKVTSCVIREIHRFGIQALTVPLTESIPSICLTDISNSVHEWECDNQCGCRCHDPAVALCQHWRCSCWCWGWKCWRCWQCWQLSATAGAGHAARQVVCQWR